MSDSDENTSEKLFEEKDFTESETIYKFFRYKRKFNKYQIVGCAFLWVFSLTVIPTIFLGEFNLGDYLEYPKLKLIFKVFLLVPVAFIMYIKTPGSIAKLLNVLWIEKKPWIRNYFEEIDDSAENLQEIKLRLKNIVNHKYTRWGIYLGVFLYLGTVFLLLDPFYSEVYHLSSQHLAIRIMIRMLYVFGNMPIAYVIVFTAFKVGAAGWLINRMFKKFNIKIDPLHVDDCGGLGYLGKKYLEVLIIMALLLLSAFGIYYENDGTSNLLQLFEGALILFAYVIMIILVTRVLILSPHKAMGRKINMTTKPMLEKYNELAESFINCKDSKSCKKALEEGESYIKLIEHIRRKYPMWTFVIKPLSTNIQKYFAFLLTVILPTLYLMFLFLFKLIKVNLWFLNF